MDCEQFTELIDAYIDRELDDNECNQMLQHFVNCNNCQKLFKYHHNFIFIFRTRIGKCNASQKLKDSIIEIFNKSEKK